MIPIDIQVSRSKVKVIGQAYSHMLGKGGITQTSHVNEQSQRAGVLALSLCLYFLFSGVYVRRLLATVSSWNTVRTASFMRSYGMERKFRLRLYWTGASRLLAAWTTYTVTRLYTATWSHQSRYKGNAASDTTCFVHKASMPQQTNMLNAHVMWLYSVYFETFAQ